MKGAGTALMGVSSSHAARTARSRQQRAPSRRRCSRRPSRARTACCSHRGRLQPRHQGGGDRGAPGARGRSPRGEHHLRNGHRRRARATSSASRSSRQASTAARPPRASTRARSVASRTPPRPRPPRSSTPWSRRSRPARCHRPLRRTSTRPRSTSLRLASPTTPSTFRSSCGEIGDRRRASGSRVLHRPRRGRKRRSLRTLNLATHVGDDHGHVDLNRSVVEDHAGAPVAYMNAAHGVARASSDGRTPSGAASRHPRHRRPWGGARGHRRGLRAVLLHDALTGAVAAAHVGRAGLWAGAVDAAIAALLDLRPHKASRAHISASVGPAICGRCYEVPLGMRYEVGERHPSAISTTRWGTPALDIPRAVETRLSELGVQTSFGSGFAPLKTPLSSLLAGKA